MAKIVGDIAVSVGADISGLQKGMKAGGRNVDAFGKKATQMGANVVKAGAVIATVMAGIAASVLTAAKAAGEAGREIKNLSDISGVGTTEFQRYAQAAKIVGVEQQKLGDIFKDVNDKFGDFMETGGGPLADFFENIAPMVGVTADQFARLSGPEALQLYVSSLEKAGVSQQRMTFYMEALASDATALLPLLRNNSEGFKKLGDEAERAGRIMSEDAIAAAVVLDRELQDMSDTLRTQAIEAVVEYKDEILAAAEFITETLIPAMGEIAGAAIDFANDLKPAIDGLSNFIGYASELAKAFSNEAFGTDFSEREGSGGGVATNGIENLPIIDSTTGIFTLPPLGDVSGSGPTGGGTGRRGSGRGGGGGGRGPSVEDFERFAENYASEAEQLEEHLAAQLEKLEEFRLSKIASEEEYNELERGIKQDHLDKMNDLEKAAQAARMQGIQGAFGDLSSLMQSENDKLFKIGQASAIAEATVSGYKAAVEAWEKGMEIGGPGMAAAFTAASLVRTGSLIAGIASQSPSGSGGASAGGGAAATPQAAPQTPLQVSLNTFGSGDFINTADFGEMLERLNDAAGDRGYTILRSA